MIHQMTTSTEEARFREIHRRVYAEVNNLAVNYQRMCDFSMDVLDWIYEHHLEHPPNWSEWDGTIELYHDPVSIYIDMRGHWEVVRNPDYHYVDLGKFRDVNLEEMDPNIWLGDFSSIEDGTDT